MKGRPPRPARRSPQERNQLALANDRLAWQTVRKLPPGLVTLLGGDDECGQIARLALLRAADLFDDTKGYKFSTYAVNCMRGNLLSALERAPLIHGPLGGQEPQRPIPRVHLADLNNWQDKAPTAEEVASRSERVERVRQAIDRLPKRQRQIITGRLAGQTLEECGQNLGVTKQRVRQLEQQAHERLARELRDLAGEVACA